ncbi:SPOR domain-containing protein [Alkalilimnicola ehrlichii]|uniref:SPOR domain-containing protein n=1 Tax=Alkalilimnicola ehrlichii TaxID=351052 RepID=UPI003B9EA523
MSDQAFKAILPPASLHRLGLLEQPFGDRPHGPAIFEDAAYRTQVNVALNLLQTGERVLLVRGGPGLGKSTFLRKLLDSAQPGVDFQPCVADPDLLFSDIWLDYLERLDPDTDHGDHVRHTQLVNLIQAMNRRGMRPVLLIDDAHDLADDTAGQVLDFWTEMAEAGEGFGLVAALDPGVEGSEEGYLAGTRLDPARVYNITLYPYDLDQTERYLRHRLQLAGGEPDLLTRKDVERIFERSGGRPGVVNLAARDLLQDKATRGGRGFALAWPDLSGFRVRAPQGRARHLLAAGVVVVIGGLLTINLFTGGFTGGGGEDAEIFDDELTLDLPPLSQAVPETVRPDEGATDHLPLGMTSDDPVAPEEGEAPTESDRQPEETPVPDPEPQLQAEPQPEPEIAAAPQPEPTTPAPEPTAPAPEPTAPAPEPEPEAADERAGEPADGDGVEAWLARGEDWVRGQPADYYTIQVLAAGGAETLLPYLSRHGLEDDAHLVLTRRQGNDWYLVLVGSHADREAAHDAIDALPGAVRAAGPWVRSLGSVTEIMP